MSGIIEIATPEDFEWALNLEKLIVEAEDHEQAIHACANAMQKHIVDMTGCKGRFNQEFYDGLSGRVNIKDVLTAYFEGIMMACKLTKDKEMTPQLIASVAHELAIEMSLIPRPEARE